MKHLLCIAAIATLSWGAAVPVAAQTPGLQLTMKDGRVTIVAKDVPLRDLLNEWSRVGGTRIINADKVTGPRITIQLVETPERNALDILLRSAAGYIAAARPDNRPGVSAYDRITILATSSAPVMNAAASPAAPTRYMPSAIPPMQGAAPSPPAPTDADNQADETIAESQDGAQEIPPQQPAVAPFAGMQPQLEGAQPRNLDLDELMRNPQGQSIAPASNPTTPRPPGAYLYPIPSRRGGG